jgi:hypothetical protein
MLMDCIGNGVVIGGYPYLLCAALCCLFGNTNHHGFSCDVQERFAGQSGGRMASRNDNMEGEHLLVCLKVPQLLPH